MELTDFQKQLIRDIESRKITSVLEYPEKYFQYSEGKNVAEHVFGIIGDFGPNDNVFLLNDENISLIELQKFISLVERLKDLKYIQEIKSTPQKVPPIFSKSKRFSGKPKPDNNILITLSPYQENIFIPNPELSIFIRNNFKTTDELRLEQSQKETRRLAYFAIFSSIFIAISTTLFNFLTYTNERVVIIKNLKDTSYVRVINPDSLKQNEVKQDSSKAKINNLKKKVTK